MVLLDAKSPPSALFAVIFKFLLLKHLPPASGFSGFTHYSPCMRSNSTPFPLIGTLQTVSRIIPLYSTCSGPLKHQNVDNQNLHWRLQPPARQNFINYGSFDSLPTNARIILLLFYLFGFRKHLISNECYDVCGHGRWILLVMVFGSKWTLTR